MNKKVIIRLFKDTLESKVLNIIDRSKGEDYEVKIVITDKGKYVLKVPHKEKNKILKEVVATHLCKKKGVPVPQVLYYNNNFLIEENIEGKDLDGVKTSKKIFSKIYYDMGKILRKMHSIKGKGFGSVQGTTLNGEYSSQKQYIESFIYKEIEKLERTKYYDSKYILKIKQHYEKEAHLLNTKESVLLHSDMWNDNIMIKDNKILGIIDFGDLCVGPPMQEFAVIYAGNYNTYKFDKILEGYGKHDMRQIEFYGFCWMIWLLASKIERKKFNKEFYDMKEKFENLWR
jgi:aminoglycoside phosphotransferase (APT) family kinase protein